MVKQHSLASMLLKRLKKTLIERALPFDCPQADEIIKSPV